MARAPAPPPPRAANLSVSQMEEAIRKIDRRLADLDAFDPDKIVERRDPNIGALEHKFSSLLEGVFGQDTIEYQRYRYDATRLDTASHNIHGTDIREVRDGLRHGVETLRTTWTLIKDGFVEEIDDAGGGAAGPAKALRAYEGLELHTVIDDAASSLYRTGHYANAIEDAVKALNAYVRMRSGVDNLDGVKLMEKVFNPSTPILKFNALADDSDRDEQKGFMFMLSGAVSGLRNPRAHRLMTDDPERALEFIAFVSLLAKLVEKARKSP